MVVNHKSSEKPPQNNFFKEGETISPPYHTPQVQATQIF